jgi:acetyl esterase/lipase
MIRKIIMTLLFCRFVVTTIALFLLTSTMPAQAQTLTFKNILDRADRPSPDHKIPYGDHADQYGELWLPEKGLPKKAATSTTPVVVLLHGGCWRADLPGPELVAFLADALRAEGVAVWSVTYRRVGTKAEKFSPYPDTFRDVIDGLEKLRELAPKYSLDLNRITTAGHSAGGHLALWLTARPNLPTDSALYKKDPMRIHATVGIAALADLAYARAASAHACGTDTVDKLIDTKSRGDAAYRDTSVTSLLPLNVPQLLISGVYDGIVAPAHALRYYQTARERAKEKNETVQLLTIDNAAHFELIAPWTEPGREVVRQIINATKARKSAIDTSQ